MKSLRETRADLFVLGARGVPDGEPVDDDTTQA
jgi:hypothetical protein